MSTCSATLKRSEPMRLLSAEAYFALWAAVVPMTTFLVIPSIQGTLPAYLLALAALPVCAFSRKASVILLLSGAALLAFYVFSQFGLIAGGVKDFGLLNLVEPDNHIPTFRKTAITQGLYLTACIATFLFAQRYYREGWMRYVFFGAWLLILYGLYEWGFFLIFGKSGDFLGNREFHSGSSVHTGSWSQTVALGPLTLLRLKSFTGEPSFFSLVAVPYLALAVGYGRKLLAAMLLLALLLSFSTSAYLGILFLAAHFSFQRRSIDRRVFAVVAAGAVAFAVLFLAFPETFTAMFTGKFRGETDSGAQRMFHMTYPLVHYTRLPLINQLFGVGFGTVYLAGTLRVLLDLGLLGVGAYLAFFLYPILKFQPSHTLPDMGWRTALLSLLFLYTVSAAELFYPTTWMMLGMTYARLSMAANDAKSAQFLLIPGKTRSWGALVSSH